MVTSPSTCRVPSVRHLLMSLINEVANEHHLVSPDRSTSTPGPFLGWRLSGSSLNFAVESEISEKDPQRHLTRHPLSA